MSPNSQSCGGEAALAPASSPYSYPFSSASGYGFPQALDPNSWEILVLVEPGDVWSCRDGSVHRALLSFEHVASSGPVLGACWMGDLGWSHCLLES